MGLAVVRSLDAPRRLASTQELEEYEQELVDQYLLAAVGAGLADSTVGGDRSVLFEFIAFLGRPSRLTVQRKAWSLAHFFDFLLVRYQGDIHALTGCVVEQVIDEFNPPVQVDPDDLLAVVCFRHRGPPCLVETDACTFQHPPGAEARSFITSGVLPGRLIGSQPSRSAVTLRCE